MCWNPEISLSTFILGTAGILIDNVNRMGGIHTNKWSILYLTIASMQLLEWAIWKYGIRNINVNKILSIIGLGIIIAQPLAAGFIIVNPVYRITYLLLYVIWVFMALLSWSPIDFRTTVAQNGHLKWHWLQPNHWLWIASWTLFVISAIYMSNVGILNATLIATFIIFFTGISYYLYAKDGTWGSVYCSLINIMFVVIIWKAMSKQYGCYRRR